ncbi:hypothetical protein P691DRAFT_617790, partial [Macrolepiota fuliginosa MF-IS2]
IDQLTHVPSNKLGCYHLTDEQWDLADDLAEALKIFKQPTQLFSQANVPLIIDVLPLFDDLQASLTALCDDTDDLSPILHIAAQAALLMVEKYTVFTEECEMYYIAIGMC